nr:putative reverse transcriptase domain-containing protein [Tanacetum cinerariifolium]
MFIRRAVLDEIHIDDKLYFVEELVEIMDRKFKRLKQSRIPIIKVRWNSRRGPKFTWEREDRFRKNKVPRVQVLSPPKEEGCDLSGKIKHVLIRK